MTKYQTTHLEDAIENLLRGIGVTRPEQLDMFIVAPRLGIDLTFSNQDTHYHGTTIHLNINQSQAELWESFGHELGHVNRHAGNQLFMTGDFMKMQEAQTSNFALHFCIPTFMLHTLALPYDFREATKILQKKFNVTIEFAAKRLKHYENQLISARSHQEFQEKCTIAERDWGLWYK